MGGTVTGLFLINVITVMEYFFTIIYYCAAGCYIKVYKRLADY